VKRTVAAITTAVLAMSLAIIGMSTGASAAPLAAACVSSPTYAYTFDKATFSGVITVSKAGVADGTPLCKVLAVRSVSWVYDLPTTTQSPSWAQTFDAKQDISVNAIGAFEYQAPNATSGCRQHDIYASFKGFDDLAIPTTLTAPGKPYEPAMLSTALGGRGPGPTYGHDASTGCNVTLPVAIVAVGLCLHNPATNTSSKTAELVYDNQLSNVPVTFAVAGNPAYTRIVAAKAVVRVALALVTTAGASYTVVAGKVSKTLTIPAYINCASFVDSDSLAVPTFTDLCGVSSDVVDIPTTTSLDNYTFSKTDNRVNGVGTVTVVAAPKAGYTFEPGVVTSFSHTFKTNSALGCLTAPAPAVEPQICNPEIENAVLSGTITIPVTAGVRYTVHPVSPAGADIVVTREVTDLAPGSYAITATALAGSTLEGTTTWTRTVLDHATGCQLPTHAFLPASVTSGNQICNKATAESGYIAIDPADGLTYFVGSTQLKAARTSFAPGTYEVQAVAAPGDAIDGQSLFAITIAAATPSCAATRFTAVGDSSVEAADGLLAATGFNGGGLFLALAGLLILAGIGLIVSVVISSGKHAATSSHHKA
jgi:hypothetical protein